MICPIVLWLLPFLLAKSALAYSSLAGINEYFLPYLPPGEGDGQRENVIRTLVRNNVRMIRVFIRPSYKSEKGDPYVNVADAEGPIGKYNDANLDIVDSFLYSVNQISNGQTKVIISPGNANDLRNFYGYCDPYCQVLGSQWLDFYTRSDMRTAYKNRLSYFFTSYSSKKFNGAKWNTLSQVILGVDVQNEPWVRKSEEPNPNIVGGDWLCDIAKHMKNALGFDKNNIAVITGGIQGSQSAKGNENWPDIAFTCSEIDIIALHGYFSTPADQPWYDMLIQEQYPGSVLRPKALKANKLLMVEEWGYNGDKLDQNRKNGDIWAGGHSLNVRGIPWTYWDLMQGSEQCSSCDSYEVNAYGGSGSSFESLAGMVNEAYTGYTEFNWGRFYPNLNPKTVNLVKTDNPYPSTGGSSCTWGCQGWKCDANTPCQGENECTNGVCKACSWGCEGWDCSTTNSPCKDVNQCVKGVCKACNWGCQGWKCDANTPCQGQNECISGTCKACTWGCLGWSCSASQPCKSVNQCVSGTCKPCQWGCPGWSCSSSQPCQGDGECRSGVCGACSWGCLGWLCSAKSPCKGENECVNGVCKPCSWGCQGWSCSSSSPCKSQYQCSSGVCKP